MTNGEHAQVLERLNWISERAKSIDARLLGIRDDVQDLTHTLKTCFAERTQFAEIVERLKQRGVIPMEFDASRLEEVSHA